MKIVNIDNTEGMTGRQMSKGLAIDCTVSRLALGSLEPAF